MRVLLDTHAFLWFMAGDVKLSRKARNLMSDKNTELVLSSASVWEMAIKASLGRLTLPLPVKDYIAAKVRSGMVILPINWRHAAAVQNLSWHHRDPFDRLIIAQAQLEELPLITADKVFSKYDISVIW